jgi:hypothetical protein
LLPGFPVWDRLLQELQGLPLGGDVCLSVMVKWVSPGEGWGSPGNFNMKSSSLNLPSLVHILVRCVKE